MKKRIILVAAFISLANSGYAADIEHKKKIIIHIDNGFSKSLNAEGTYDNHFNGSMILGGGVKVEITPKIKMGVSLSHRPGFKYHEVVSDSRLVQAQEQKLGVTTVLYNVSYDIYKIQDVFTPFIEGGVGFARMDIGPRFTTSTSNATGVTTVTEAKREIKYNPVWNIGGGVSMNLIKNTTLSAVYKFNHFGEITTRRRKSRWDGTIKSHEFLASLSFTL
jgi:opacity protein-like surface antigen